MRQTSSMIIAQLGKADGNPSTTVTDQVCLRRCMVTLQQLQLWLLGASASISQRIDKLQLPCAWLQLEPVCLPLKQLRNMAESIFPIQIMRGLPLPSASVTNLQLPFDPAAVLEVLQSGPPSDVLECQKQQRVT